MRSQRRSLSRFSTLLAPEFSSNPTKLSLTPRRHKRQLTFRQPLDAHCTPSLSVPTAVSYCFQSFRFNHYPLTFSIPPLLLLISHLEHLHNHARFPMLIRVRTGALSNVASTRRPPSPSEPRLIPLRLISLYPVPVVSRTTRKKNGDRKNEGSKCRKGSRKIMRDYERRMTKLQDNRSSRPPLIA